MSVLRGTLPLLALLLAAVPAGAADWATFTTPSEHAPTSVGGYANGCLLGGSELAPEGAGYQVIRLSRHRYFGHPQLVDYLTDLGERVEKAGLGVMLVGDIAMPRGGPFTSGHRSHQTGLDADIWLRLDLPRMQRAARDDLDAVVMVDHKHLRPATYWTSRQAELVRLAATDPRVARIFVHPVIKQALCDTAGEDRAWLRNVRPWYRHDAHFHVRLNCPESDRSCEPQLAPPPGDGCGAELSSWIENLRNPKPSGSRPKEPPPPLPSACQALLTGGDDAPTIGMNLAR